MEQSLFQQYVTRFFTGVALKLTQLINGKSEEALPQTYLYKTMLRTKFSPTLKWNTLTVKGRRVMADVVSLDASFPLKKRGAVSRAEGDIPKMASKRSLNETQMTDIMVLESMPGDNSIQIARILFEDTTAVVTSIWERIEYQFLQALSSGVFSVANETEDDQGNSLTNIGTEFRVDLMLPDNNKFGAAIKWSEDNATPIDDIERITSYAKTQGHKLTNIFMDTPTWNKFKKNTQVRQYLAGFSGAVVVVNNSQILRIPNFKEVNDYLLSEYGITITIIDRSVIAERDGVDKVLNAWTENAVVFTQSTIVGDLVYGQLAAEKFPNKNVSYAKVDGYILVSKYQKLQDTPLEFTTSQARVIPVVDMSDIYIMDCEEAQPTGADFAGDDLQTEGDATLTIYGDTTVLRVNVINALKDLGVKGIASNITDATLVKKVNELNESDETAFKLALEIPVVNAGADTTANSATKALVGTATAAGDKTIASVLWEKVSGPAGSGFSAPTSLSTNATGLVTGVYVFKLTATDSAGTIASDTITVTATVA